MLGVHRAGVLFIYFYCRASIGVKLQSRGVNLKCEAGGVKKKRLHAQATHAIQSKEVRFAVRACCLSLSLSLCNRARTNLLRTHPRLPAAVYTHE